MAKKRERPVENPLLRDRVQAISGDAAPTPPAEPEERVNIIPRPAPRRQSIPQRRRGREEVHAKTRMTREEADAMERFTRTLSAHLQTRIMGSEVTRALWAIAAQAEERIAQVAHKAPSLERPSNGDRMAMAEFEDAIVEFLQRVLR